MIFLKNSSCPATMFNFFASSNPIILIDFASSPALSFPLTISAIYTMEMMWLRGSLLGSLMTHANFLILTVTPISSFISLMSACSVLSPYSMNPQGNAYPIGSYFLLMITIFPSFVNTIPSIATAGQICSL